jgi:hypothetical protein
VTGKALNRKYVLRDLFYVVAVVMTQMVETLVDVNVDMVFYRFLSMRNSCVYTDRRFFF